MWNYEAVVACTAKLLPRPLALVGWSMGGLVALLAVHRVEPQALVLLEPWPPAEVQGYRDDVEPATGTYGGDEPGERPESLLAQRERERGLSVPEVSCPTLVVHGDEFGPERGSALASFYGTEDLHLPGASHVDLVRDPEIRARVGEWLRRRLR